MVNRTAITIGLLLLFYTAQSQLKPGFDKEEYISLMKVSAQFGDSAYASLIPPPAGYELIYRSPVMGLDNRWDLWKSNKGDGIISIRGTTTRQVSWLANFYAAMVPAEGELQLSETEKFKYRLATDPRAAVHIGWLVGTGFLSKDILPKIDSAYKSGTRNFYILGHSQGGAIAFLLTAYLHHLQKQQLLPGDIRFKTYCSAGPKPGNLYFAYEYETMTQGGWAFNIVNPVDWVPQTPFSVQTLEDFAQINPFVNAKVFLKKQKWPSRWALNHAYGRLTKPSRKALKNYKKYLGNYVSKAVGKNLKGYAPPAYFNSNDYVRTGNTIVLSPDADYFQKFVQDPKKIFINHLHQPYLFLASQLNADPSLTR
ncbi:MAG TPA: lipase family protein [Chitinophagaceae bacterium]